MNDRLQIIFLLSNSRSGSTILERTLGQIPNFCSIGEVRHLWNRGILQEQLCGCGTPLRDCEFWHQVIKHLTKNDNISSKTMEINNLAISVTRFRYLIIKHFPTWAKGKLYPHDETKRFVNYLSDLYNSIATVSNKKIIVDSSKLAWYGSLVSEIPNADIHVVHLVRDSRAVVFSHQRKRVRPEIRGKEILMDIIPWWRVCLTWNISNLSSYLLKSSNIASKTFLRYEDFVNKPIPNIKKITDKIGDYNSDINIIFPKENIVSLGINHTISGNPSRFKLGDVSLQLDNEWVEKMPKGMKRRVTIATFPLLLKYGYFKGWSTK